MTWKVDDDDLAGGGLAGLIRQYESGLAHLGKVARDDVEGQVEHLQYLASTLGLGKRLLRTYDEVKFVAPGRRPQLKQWGCVVRGHEVKGAERATVVRIELQRRPYILTFREPEVSYEDVKAYLDLHADKGQLLFSALLHLDVNEPGDGWVPGTIEAFIPGDWVKDFLELSLHLDQTTHGTDVSPTDDLRKKFGL